MGISLALAITAPHRMMDALANQIHKLTAARRTNDKRRHYIPALLTRKESPRTSRGRFQTETGLAPTKVFSHKFRPWSTRLVPPPDGFRRRVAKLSGCAGIVNLVTKLIKYKQYLRRYALDMAVETRGETEMKQAMQVRDGSKEQTEHV